MVDLTVLSLGAGWQSTTLALMAAHGEVTPMPDYAIFADTGNEKRATYAHLDWLATKLPYPIIRKVRSGKSLSAETIEHYRGDGGSPYTPPFFYDGGMLPIRCSKEWKTRVIIKELRRQLGYEYGERVVRTKVEMWLGFTTDEAHRMKPSEAKWITNRWPLVERRMHRGECEPWLTRHGYPLPPRSACTHCPLQTDGEFAIMAPDDFKEACAFDDAIREGGGGTDGPLYVSRHLRPLRDIDFAALANTRQLDLFGNECEGMCGV